MAFPSVEEIVHNVKAKTSSPHMRRLDCKNTGNKTKENSSAELTDVMYKVLYIY